MEEMANAAEVIEKLAREAERLQLLEMARGCKDLNELIEKLEALTANKLNGERPPDQGLAAHHPKGEAGSLTPATP